MPVEDWPRHYAGLAEAIFAGTRPERITLGGICSYGTALRLTAQALGSDNVIARRIAREPSPDGRRRFPREFRIELIEVGLEVRLHHARRRAALEQENAADDDLLDEQFLFGAPAELSAHGQEYEVA